MIYVSTSIHIVFIFQLPGIYEVEEGKERLVGITDEHGQLSVRLREACLNTLVLQNTPVYQLVQLFGLLSIKNLQVRK